MKFKLVFILSLVTSAICYGQDSSSRNAVGKTGDITKEIPGSENDVRPKSNNQINRNAQPVNTNETIPQNVTGDLNDNKKNPVSEKSTKEGPK